MSAAGPAVITSVGMVTALGDSAVAAAAALRARMARFREWPAFPCRPADPPRPGEPFPAVVAFVDGPRGTDVPLRLFSAALQDLVRSADLARQDLEDATFVIARPMPHAADYRRALCDSFAQAAASQVGVASLGRALLSPDGHAAMLLGLAQAARAVAAEPEIACVVVGADSYLDPVSLEILEEAGRLKSRRNLDGFVPGEAGAAILVEHRSRAERRGATMLVEIEGAGAGSEAHPLPSGDPATGEGLAAALAAACAAGGPPAWIACDMNGEGYRGKELAFARIRKPPLFAELRALWHPADGYGDVGAATGGCLAAVCVAAMARGVAPCPRVVVTAASDDGTRAAVALASPGGGGKN